MSVVHKKVATIMIINNLHRVLKLRDRLRSAPSFKLIYGSLIVALLANISLQQQPTSLLEHIRQQNKLTVITRHDPTTYFHNQHGESGFEYRLAAELAEELGVKLEMVTASNLDEILNAVNTGRAHIAAAGLTVTEKRLRQVNFSIPYHHITQKVIYKNRNKQPFILADLEGARIAVLANSSHHERLKEIQKDYPKITWKTLNGNSTEPLLQLLKKGEIDYTVVDSNAFHVHRSLYPQLKEGFDISEPEPLAWALAISADQSLYYAVQSFIAKKHADGFIDDLAYEHFGKFEGFTYFDAKLFLARIKSRLPQYHALFQSAAKTYDLDWRLLAAISYQESLWDAEATSPTGVRGLMMLTHKTAEVMGVTDRVDPKQSIIGGTAYMRKLLNKLPKEISGSDRTWLALAAYNLGRGHVQDAQHLTQAQGANPYKWEEVKKRLPLLKQEQWYSKTQYGQAKAANQALIYVKQIRQFYDLLIWSTDVKSDNQIALIESKPKA